MKNTQIIPRAQSDGILKKGIGIIQVNPECCVEASVLSDYIWHVLVVEYTL